MAVTTAADKGPLSYPVFRALWIATIISNIGTWMNDVGSGWLMTSLSPSPLMVALVQAATTLPMFLLSLPAGALADIIDRRKMLLTAQFLGMITAAVLALSTVLDLTTPWMLLTATFLMGVAAALSGPIFQAIVPELVGKETLPDAIALNSLGINISRAIGPALGGVIVALAGIPAVFALNAVSVLAVIFVVFRWKREPTKSQLPPEFFFAAMKAGVRYARHSPAMHVVLIRALGFFVFGSALWAMLPLIGRHELGLSAAGYGALLGAMGVGAIAGAVALKRLRRRVAANTISILSTLLLAFATAALAIAPNAWIGGAVMFTAGLAWIGMMTSLNVAAQMASAGWVKARALAIYILVFQGSMAGGSVLWGTVATNSSVRMALLIAAVGQVLALALALRWQLPKSSASDLAPSNHWGEPVVAAPISDDRGPVLVEIEYRVALDKTGEFITALRRFSETRRRDGAIRWDVWEDIERPGVVVEAFIVESWVEHLRQHQRTTQTDAIQHHDLRHFHIDPDAPKVRHFIAPR